MGTFFDDSRHVRYLDWLMTAKADRQPVTVSALADEIGVDRRTLRDWRYNPEFVAEWDKRVKNTVGSPERTKQIMDTLYKTATDREDGKHVQAAMVYFKRLGEISPSDELPKADLSELSEEELRQLIASAAREELEGRQLKVVGE